VVGDVKKHRITKVFSRTDLSSCKCAAVREWYILPRFIAIIFNEKKKIVCCLLVTLQNVIGFGTVAGPLSRLYGVLWLQWLSSDNHLFSIIGSKVGAVVRALGSHQCGPGTNPGVDAQCWLSLLWVLSLLCEFTLQVQCTPVFSTPQKPTFSN